MERHLSKKVLLLFDKMYIPINRKIITSIINTGLKCMIKGTYAIKCKKYPCINVYTVVYLS